MVPRRARGRVHELGAERGGDRPPEPGDAPLRIERERALADRAARLVGGDLVLAAGGHPLHGAAELARQPGQQHVLAVGPGLHPESAAHVGGDDAHPALRQLEQARDLATDAERGLAGHPHGQLGGRAVEGGQDRARLHRHRGDAVLRHAQRHDVGRRREGAMSVTFPNDPREHAVAVDAGEEQRRAGRQGGLGLREAGQRLVVHADEIERVVGRVDILGHHRGHRHADRVDLALGQDGMRRHAHVGHQAVHRHGAEMGHVLAGDHQPRARGAPRGLHVEADDAGVGVRGAEQGHVQAPRRRHVVHEGARAGQEAVVLAPLERPADPAVALALAHPRNRETAPTKAAGCSYGSMCPASGTISTVAPGMSPPQRSA